MRAYGFCFLPILFRKRECLGEGFLHLGKGACRVNFSAQGGCAALPLSVACDLLAPLHHGKGFALLLDGKGKLQKCRLYALGRGGGRAGLSI